MSRHHFRPVAGPTPLEVTPATAGWRYLSFGVWALEKGEARTGQTGGLEVALVPLSGELEVQVGTALFHLKRRNVFSELPPVLYLPPACTYQVTALQATEMAWGGAPAEGRYPLRLFQPPEMQVEMRGGGHALRQVSHILGPHLPAERLILYEVYTPSGSWSGWPPHRHDGQMGSLYLEETYYYKVNPRTGWAIHRNYSPEEGLDELLLARDGELILAPKGYHPVVAPPGSNVYYLNYMAGEALCEQRATPPVDEPEWAWMRQDWSGQPMALPIGKK